MLLPGGYRLDLSDAMTTRSQSEQRIYKQVDEAASTVPAQAALPQVPDLEAMRRTEVRIVSPNPNPYDASQ